MLFYTQTSCSTTNEKDQSLSCKLTRLPLSSNNWIFNLSMSTGPEYVLTFSSNILPNSTRGSPLARKEITSLSGIKANALLLLLPALFLKLL